MTKTVIGILSCSSHMTSPGNSMHQMVYEFCRLARISAIAFALFVCSTNQTKAQWNDDAEQCYQMGALLPRVDADASPVVDYCSKAIQSGELTRAGLAVTHSNRGIAYTKAGKFDSALADFNAAIKWNPEYAEVYNNRCQLLAQLGDLQRAIADCDRAIELTPGAANSYDSRGYALLQSGEYARAMQDYDTAVQLDPELMESYFGRGVANIRLGNREAGERDLAKAREIDPTIDEFMRRLGVVP